LTGHCTIGRPLSTKADDLDPLLLGQENTATNPTRITTTGNIALERHQRY